MPRRQWAEGAPGGRGSHLRAWRGRHRAPSDTDLSLGEALWGLLESMGGTPERAGLQRLWDNWETALGAELAGLAQPLGHHAASHGGRRGEGTAAGAILLLGAKDSMLLQELHFRSEEILARVNGFLGQAYFSEVQVSLPLGRSAPVRSRKLEKLCTTVSDAGEQLPGPSGVFLDAMDRTSPVARCYARFAGQPDAELPENAPRREDQQKASVDRELPTVQVIHVK